MPRPVRELWSSLGAEPGDSEDVIVVGAAALSLESVFGGALEGDVAVRLFSDEAFGFVGPEELAALGVFWAPHLEDGKQLRAAVLDAQDRLRRKLAEASERLGQLGLRARLEAPVPVTRGRADIGGLALDVVLGEGGELLLERVDGAEVPAGEREVMRELGGASREQVQDTLAAHAHRLVQEGLVEPAAVEPALAEEADGFSEDPHTAQLAAASLLGGGDTGTLLVPPPSDDGDALDVEAAGEGGEGDARADAAAADLVAALDDDDLASSEEGPAHEELSAAAPGAGADEGAPNEGHADAADDAAEVDTLGPASLDEPTMQGVLDDDASAHGADSVGDVALAGEAGDDVPAPDVDVDVDLDIDEDDEDGDEEDELHPATSPALSDRTAPPESFAAYPALPTQRMSVMAPDELAAETALAEPASGFGEDTGEQRAVLSLSGDDGVMPSPAEATLLRPAPTSDELDLDDDAGDEEETLAKAPVFEAGRKGPSLVSSGSAGSSVDEAPRSAAVSDESEEGDAAEASSASAPIVDEDPPDAVEEDEHLDVEPAEERLRAEPAADGALIEDMETPTALHGFSLSASDDADPSLDALDRLEAEPTDPSLGVIARANDEAPLDLPSSLEVDLEADDPDAAADDEHAEDEEDADEEESEERTEAGAALGASGERFDALAAIVGEGMSSGKTGAIVLDADAFAYLRGAEDAPAAAPSEDPDALEHEAEALERKARELRSKAELLRERAATPAPRRKLASALEKARSGRVDEDPRAEPSAESVPSDEGSFAGEVSDPALDAFASAPSDEDQALEASDVDAFADGVALEEVRAMLAADERRADVYAETQLAEMDLGELRQPSLSGGVFEGGVEDDRPPYALDEPTGHGAALGTAMASLPQAASADVQALLSVAERASEPAARKRMPAGKPPSREAKPPLTRALALVVSDPRARERLKKHLEETFPHVVELANPREAASLSAKDVQAVVIVRPTHDDATVSGLEALEGSRTRPPVLVLSSDASFDGLPGVDLRLALGRRASEVARQVLEGLSTLGVRASA